MCMFSHFTQFPESSASCNRQEGEKRSPQSCPALAGHWATEKLQPRMDDLLKVEGQQGLRWEHRFVCSTHSNLFCHPAQDHLLLSPRPSTLLSLHPLSL